MNSESVGDDSQSTTANVYYETHGEKGEWITLINEHFERCGSTRCLVES